MEVKNESDLKFYKKWEEKTKNQIETERVRDCTKYNIIDAQH